MTADWLGQAIREFPEGHRIYAVGDIHGMVDCLEAVLGRIAADRLERPAASITEIFLGDVIDRGPDSAGVLSRLAERRDAILLCGNHELAMLRALLCDDDGDRWMRIGARETLMSYGIVPPPSQKTAEALSELRARLPAAHVALLKNLRGYYRFGGFLFVHAGIRPGLPIEEQSLRDLTTIRGPFLDSTAYHGAIVVHGHTPSERPDIRSHRINLDTGAYHTRQLSCLAIDRTGLRLI